MQKTETALTLLIQFIDSQNQKLADGISDKSTYTYKSAKTVLDGIKDEAISLLQKEREDIKNAHIEGFKDGLEQGLNNEATPQSFNHNYFNQAFTQYKEHE